MIDKAELTPVIFRRFRDDQRVIALFPSIPGDYAGDKCQSYMRVGQHSAATYHGVMNDTIPVSQEAEDVKSLKAELIRIGYTNLKIYQKEQRKHREARFESSREYRNPR